MGKKSKTHGFMGPLQASREGLCLYGLWWVQTQG